MNYETAKALKDVGFPQEVKIGDHYFADNGQTRWLSNIGTRQAIDGDVLDPTLEEMIEACPHEIEPKEKKLGLMARFTLSGKPGDYIAFYETPLKPEEPIGEGATPSIAVAKLYIALHTV